MGKPNAVFKKSYEEYLQQLGSVSSACWSSVLAINVDEANKTAEIPFFNRLYSVSPTGINDEHGNCPNYGICVILLKYLLMCPGFIPTKKTWAHSRDFRDTVHGQNTGMSDYATQNISELFSGNLDLLKMVVNELEGTTLENEYPYDLSVVIVALPRIPVLFLFNNNDEHFPAQTSILYESRAHYFLDAECRVMVDWYLFEMLKSAASERVDG